MQIEAEVEQLWGNPLDLLDLQVGASRDTGRDFIDEHRDDALRSGDYAIQALSRLHVSACQTSQEILVLLRSGFADGALARWRTLHEAVVIATVIKKYGNESAERYLCHDVVHRYRSLNEMRDFLLNSDQEFTPDSEYDATETLFELYVCKFGKPFKLDYGWAAPITRPKNPNVYKLEKLTDNNYLRYYYKIASHYVHVNAPSDYNWKGEAKQVDPGHYGLATPGLLSAHSLGEITSIMLKVHPSRDKAVVGLALMNLVNEIKDSFRTIEHDLEARMSAREPR